MSLPPLRPPRPDQVAGSSQYTDNHRLVGTTQSTDDKQLTGTNQSTGSKHPVDNIQMDQEIYLRQVAEARRQLDVIIATLDKYNGPWGLIAYKGQDIKDYATFRLDILKVIGSTPNEIAVGMLKKTQMAIFTLHVQLRLFRRENKATGMVVESNEYPG